MKARKSSKFLIAMSVLCLVTISAVTATAVYAAQTITGSGSTTVSYTALGEVMGSIKATTISGGTETPWGKTVTYNGKEADGTTTSPLTENNITLTKTNKSIVYKFEFSNSTSSAVANKGYKIDLAYTASGTNTNVKVSYAIDSNSDASYTEDATLTIPQQEVSTTPKTIFIKVEIVDVLNNASFGGAFNWTLTAN